MTSAKATAKQRWQLVEALAQDNTLSSIDVRLGLLLLSKYYNAKYGCAWPSRELLIEELGASRASITRSIDRLEQRGYFACQHNKGRGINNRYFPRFVVEADHSKRPIQPEARDADQRRAAARQPKQRPRSPKQAPPAAYTSRIPSEIVAQRDAGNARRAAERERRAKEAAERGEIPFGDDYDWPPDPEREEAGRRRAERWREDPTVIAMERVEAEERARADRRGRDVGDAGQVLDEPSPVDPEKGSPTRPFSGKKKGSPVHIKGLMGERKRAHRCGKIPLKIPPKKHLMPLAELTALAGGSRFSPESGQQESPRATPEPMPATPASASGDGVTAYNDEDGDVASTEPVSAEPVQRHLRVFSDVLARARKPVKDASWWRERERQTEATACKTPEAMTAYWLEALEEVAA